MIAVRKCKYGRGLFATETIQKGEIIEISPVIVVPKTQEPIIKFTSIQTYLFEWDKDQALALGYGSLFNHSTKPNVTYNKLKRRKEMEFVALRKIRKGSQLFINYGYDMRAVKTWNKYLRENQKALINGEFK